MTEPEQQEIDAWFAAVQQAQPPGTLAALVYVRDGTVNLGRGDIPLEVKEFPADDLEVAGELIGRGDIPLEVNEFPPDDLEVARELIAAAVEDAGPK